MQDLEKQYGVPSSENTISLGARLATVVQRK